MSDTESLGQAFPKEQARCRELLVYYREIGPAAQFGLLMIEAVLKRADQAAISGDLIAMLQSFQELKGCA